MPMRWPYQGRTEPIQPPVVTWQDRAPARDPAPAAKPRLTAAVLSCVGLLTPILPIPAPIPAVPAYQPSRVVQRAATAPRNVEPIPPPSPPVLPTTTQWQPSRLRRSTVSTDACAYVRLPAAEVSIPAIPSGPAYQPSRVVRRVVPTEACAYVRVPATIALTPLPSVPIYQPSRMKRALVDAAGCSFVRLPAAEIPPVPTIIPSTLEWEARFYSSAGKRIRLPQDWITSAEFELIERGGCGTGSLTVLARWEDLALAGTERVDIYVRGVPLYRGYLRMPSYSMDSDGESTSITLQGSIEMLNNYLCDRKYAYGIPVDLSQVFSDIIYDCVASGTRFPDATIDTDTVGATTMLFDATGKSVAQALNALCDLAPAQAVWGAEIDADTLLDTFFMRARAQVDDAAKYRVAVGGRVRGFVYPPDVGEIANRVRLTGGSLIEPSRPNILHNPSFEDARPAGPSGANLLRNPGFETGWGSGEQYWNTIGGATISSSTDSVHDGSRSLILDNNPSAPEGAYQDVNVGSSHSLLAAVWVCPYVTGLNYHIIMDAYDSSDALVGTNDYNSFSDLPAYVWYHDVMSTPWVPPAGTVRIRLTVESDSANPYGSNLAIDDVSLWFAESVASDGWTSVANNDAMLADMEWDYSTGPAAFAGAYCARIWGYAMVTGPASTTYGYVYTSTPTTDFVAIQPNQDNWVSASPNNRYTLLARACPTGSVASQVSLVLEEYDSDYVLIRGTEYVLTTDTAEEWSDVLSLSVVTQTDTAYLVPQLRLYTNTRVAWDALMLVKGDAPADVLNYPTVYWDADAFKACGDASDFTGYGDISLPADVVNSIATYGEREKLIANEAVVDWDTWKAFIVGYLKSYAVPMIRGSAELTIGAAGDIVRPDGCMRLLNLRNAPDPLFVSRASYKIGDEILVELDLGNERPEVWTLMQVVAAQKYTLGF